eukprot:4272327-Amphidinium_carterae.1
MANARENTEWILVLYAEEGRTVWHQRRVWGRLACWATEEPRYIIQTPDGDMYAEQYVGNDDVTAFRWCTVRWPPPAGIDRRHCYRFANEIGAGEEANRWLRAEALALEYLQEEAIQRGQPGTLPQGAVLTRASNIAIQPAPAMRAQPVVPIAAPQVIPQQNEIHKMLTTPHPPLQLGVASVGWNWILAEDVCEGWRFGKVLEVGAGAGQVTLLHHSGRRGLVRLPSAAETFALLVGDGEKRTVEAGWCGQDMRLLPVFDPSRQRHRSWLEAASLVNPEGELDMPIQGPRTSRWCTQYLIKEGGSIQHHENWRARKRLNGGEFGLEVHEVLSEVIEYLLLHDEVDITNSVGAEVCFRKLQLVEYHYEEKQQGSQSQRIPAEQAAALSLAEASGRLAC